MFVRVSVKWQFNNSYNFLFGGVSNVLWDILFLSLINVKVHKPVDWTSIGWPEQSLSADVLSYIPQLDFVVIGCDHNYFLFEVVDRVPNASSWA